MNAPAEGTAEGAMAGLAGKAALVTGGASGIGAGIARVLAAAGAAVASCPGPPRNWASGST